MGRKPEFEQIASAALGVRIKWTAAATGDLVRLHSFLAPVAPEAAANIAQDLARAPARLVDYPRIGEKLDAYEPREVRRIIVGRYEVRYELAGDLIIVLRLRHQRENRSFDEDG